MASIVSYETKSGERLWRVRYRKLGSNRSTDKSGFRRKRDAELWASRNAVSVAEGTFVDPARGKITVGSLSKAWLDKKRINVKPSYFDDLEGAMRKYVLPQWGSRSVKDIRKEEIQAWVSRLAMEKSASVVLRANGVLAGIFDDAVDNGRVVRNPARGVSLPKKTRKPHVYLTALQLASLAKAAGEHGLLILVLGLVGMRWGECVGLRVKDVDMKKHRISVTGSATQVGSRIVVGSTKSGKPRRVVFPDVLDNALSEQIRGRGADEILFPGPLEGYMRQPRAPRTRSSWFSRACDEADVPRMTIHDLRHTAASLMVKSGANVKAVQLQLGHTSAAMTLDVYADLFDDDLDAVGVAMSRLLLKNSVGFLWDSVLQEAA